MITNNTDNDKNVTLFIFHVYLLTRTSVLLIFLLLFHVLVGDVVVVVVKGCGHLLH